MSILGVLLVLGVASVSAYHMTEGAGEVMTVSDRNMMNCDVNPYDSVDTCADQQANMNDRQTVTNSQLISDRQTVSDTGDTWLVLQCRVTDGTQTVSDRGQTSSTFGRSTASNNTNNSMNNAFDRQTTGMNTGDRVSVTDMEMLECYIVDESSQSDRQTVSDRTTITTSGTSWSDQWDYNNPNRATSDGTMTVDGNGQRMDSDATRGFESPVVYQNTLDTSRTSEEQAD